MKLHFKFTNEFTDDATALKDIINRNKEKGIYKKMFKFNLSLIIMMVVIGLPYFITKDDRFIIASLIPFVIAIISLILFGLQILNHENNVKKGVYKGIGYYKSNKFVVDSIDDLYSWGSNSASLYKRITYFDLNDKSKTYQITMRPYKLNSDLKKGDVFSIKLEDKIFYNYMQNQFNLNVIDGFFKEKIINHGKIIKIKK